MEPRPPPRKAYSTDLTDDQWHLLELLEPLVPAAKQGGRRPKYERREIVNALFYVTKNGCTWRNLPHDLPPWSLVHYYFWHWKRDGTWQTVHDHLRQQVRTKSGRDPQPTAAVLDSQSVKTTEKGGHAALTATKRSFDGNKKIIGRKRHLLVDTQGLMLNCLVTPANIGDRDGAKALLRRCWLQFPRLSQVWADGNYDGPLIEWFKTCWNLDLEIVVKPADQKGFSVLPRRWVVERTFSWLGKQRRLSKDYEERPASSVAFIQIALSALMVRRLVPE